MRLYVPSSVVALLLCGCVSVPQANRQEATGVAEGEELGPTDLAEEEAAVLRAAYEMVDAFNHQDLDRLMSLHHPDVVYMIPSRPAIEGWDAIRTMYDRIFTHFREAKRYRYLQPTTDRQIVVMGDWAWMRGGTYSVMAPMGETPSIEPNSDIFVKTVGIYKKENGRWLRYLQMRNGNTSDMNI